MRHKLGVVILATVMTIAGTREAFRQFGELKSSINDWTRTSILGNLLVFAGGGAEASGAQSQALLLAETYTACKGQRSSPATQTSRPASKPKAASAEHMLIEKSLVEKSPDTRGLEGLAQSLSAARDNGSREQLIVKAIPQFSEIAKTLGAEFNEREAEKTTFRAGESVATRTRVVAELRKLGLRRVYVRVAKMEGSPREVNVFHAHLPETFALELKSLAGLPDATTNESAHTVAPQEASLPLDQFDRNLFYVSHASLDCDGDALN
ncbi:MAG: hypothetical protein QOE33_2153 [Acidobacteriota bacterium]|nr:hypothetical protein [Acidobacteriota bacterium]